MIDFRLKVFHAVAKRLNFTKAAEALFISQPAVTKHIRALESSYNITLIERSGNKKISLTAAGEMLLNYADQVFALHRELEYDISLLAKKETGVLRIGASSTIAQYVIPALLAQFHQKFQGIKVQMISGNTENIEQALLNKDIEIGIVEGISRNPQIKYETFLKDELVLVCASKNATFKRDTIKPEELKNYPFLLREPGSGTLDVLAHALKSQQIKLKDLQVEMQLASTESIKSYLLQSDCMAFLSIHAVLKELKNNEFRVVDVKSLSIERPFNFIQAHGQPDARTELFIRFAKTQAELM